VAPGNARSPATGPGTPGQPTVNLQANQIYFEGAVIEPISPLVAAHVNAQVTDGAFVTTVYPDTAAERAGLNAGDIIFKLNGRWVADPAELMLRANEYVVGDNLRLGTYTGGQRKNLYLVLSGNAQRPAPIANPAGTPMAVQRKAKELNWAGMELKPITEAIVAKDNRLQGKRGALVKDVDGGSAAENAGLRKGDIVKRVNGVPVNNIDVLDQVVGAVQLDRGVLMQIERDGRTFFITMVQG
jgi:serine protease Do